MKAGNWDYADAPGSTHGTMKCTACGKPVETGRYRFRQKSRGSDWGYQVQHEACCPDDPKWTAIDATMTEPMTLEQALDLAIREWSRDEQEPDVKLHPEFITMLARVARAHLAQPTQAVDGLTIKFTSPYNLPASPAPDKEGL